MVNQKPLRVMIMAGGTGGHIFPALAVAREFEVIGAQVYWLGSAKGMETQLIPETGIPLFLLPVQGVRGRGITGLAKAPVLITRAIWRARKILKDNRPDLVVGFGGFASGPGGVAARMLGKPLVIHEQNAVAGTTNRLLAKVASRVLTAFPKVLSGACEVGNPVRSDITQVPEPALRWASRGEQQAMRLLVLGGSRGAQFINELVPDALAGMSTDQRPSVWHQAGRDQGEALRERYEQLGLSVWVDEFIDDMADAYRWADLVICRAGALTVSELMAVGIPAILVPFPYAIDDHQTRNAEVLVRQGAAIALAQKDMTPDRLASLLLNEFKRPEDRLARAQKGRKLARTDAAKNVVQQCLEVVRG